MSNTLTKRFKSDQELRQLSVGHSLRVAGVLAAAVLVFIALYYFVAALEVR
jgi:hypothetical protein